MTKRQLIDEILTLNRSARPEFLARFGDQDLGEYLDHLQATQKPRLQGDAGRFEHYFEPFATDRDAEQAGAEPVGAPNAADGPPAAPGRHPLFRIIEIPDAALGLDAEGEYLPATDDVAASAKSCQPVGMA